MRGCAARRAGAADDADRCAEDRRGIATPDDFGRKNMMLLRNTASINFFDLCAISLPMPRSGGLADRPDAGRRATARIAGCFDIAARSRTASETDQSRLPRRGLSGALYMIAKVQSTGEKRSCPIASTLLNRRRLLAGAAATTTAARRPGDRPRAGRGAEGRRAAAAFRRAGRHRPGLLPRRRLARADLQEHRPARASDHECRHRNQRRRGALRAEKLIADGAQLLVGAFDSGQSTAIAQVAEQKGIPFVINIAAAPPITEQGYKFVFRNFPTAPMILGDAFANQKEVFDSAARRRSRWCSCTSTTRSAWR